MTTIKFNLSTSSIEQAIKDLKAYQKQVQGLGPKVVKRMVEGGTEQAKELVDYMGAYDSGDLLAGIVGTVDGKKGAIHSTSGHSAYVEYGTGIVGAGSPHPEAGSYPGGWRYDVNEHGEAGWWYPGKDGKYRWTKGMPHRPFMYETAQILRQSVEDIAKSEMEGGSK